MLAMVGALSGMFKKPGARVPDALSSSTSQSAEDVRARSKDSENVQYQSSNSRGRMPGLCGVDSSRSRDRRRSREDRNWQDKKMDHEFDFVLVPSDGVYMSGSESDDSDWSVGWFEPHSASFTDNEDEEKFQVLVPSYRASAAELNPPIHKSESKDSNTPPWASLLSNLTQYTNSGSLSQFHSSLDFAVDNNARARIVFLD